MSDNNGERKRKHDEIEDGGSIAHSAHEPPPPPPPADWSRTFYAVWHDPMLRELILSFNRGWRGYFDEDMPIDVAVNAIVFDCLSFFTHNTVKKLYLGVEHALALILGRHAIFEWLLCNVPIGKCTYMRDIIRYLQFHNWPLEPRLPYDVLFATLETECLNGWVHAVRFAINKLCRGNSHAEVRITKKISHTYGFVMHGEITLACDLATFLLSLYYRPQPLHGSVEKGNEYKCAPINGYRCNPYESNFAIALAEHSGHSGHNVFFCIEVTSESHNYSLASSVECDTIRACRDVNLHLYPKKSPRRISVYKCWKSENHVAVHDYPLMLPGERSYGNLFNVISCENLRFAIFSDVLFTRDHYEKNAQSFVNLCAEWPAASTRLIFYVRAALHEPIRAALGAAAAFPHAVFLTKPE